MRMPIDYGSQARDFAKGGLNATLLASFGIFAVAMLSGDQISAARLAGLGMLLTAFAWLCGFGALRYADLSTSSEGELMWSANLDYSNFLMMIGTISVMGAIICDGMSLLWLVP